MKPKELFINEDQNPEFLAAGDASIKKKKSITRQFLRTSAQGNLDTAGHTAACLCRIYAEKGESDKT